MNAKQSNFIDDEKDNSYKIQGPKDSID